jgi:hypothetical protein
VALGRCKHQRHKASRITTATVKRLPAARATEICVVGWRGWQARAETAKAGRVGLVERIIRHIGVEVHVVPGANRVALQKPAEVRRVKAGAVVIKSALRINLLASVAEAHTSGGVGFAKGPIAVFAGGEAAIVGLRHHRAQMIGMQPAPVGGV